MLKFLGVIAGLALGSTMDGVAINQMWTWFVIPKFPAPALGILAAIGLGMTTRLLAGVAHLSAAMGEKESGKEALLASIVRGILLPLVVLGLGAIVHALQ